MYKKIFSPLSVLAFVSFLLAGSSFYILSAHPKVLEATIEKTITVTTTPVPTQATQTITAIASAPTSLPQPTTTQSTTTIVTQHTTTSTTVSQSGPYVALSLHVGSNLTTWAVSLSGTQTPCSILQAAKDQGKLSSLTIQHYGAPLNSDYVKEINGNSDNWTFTLNGDSKNMGCSYYSLNSGDTVVWSYQ